MKDKGSLKGGIVVGSWKSGVRTGPPERSEAFLNEIARRSDRHVSRTARQPVRNQSFFFQLLTPDFQLLTSDSLLSLFMLNSGFS